MHFFNDIYKYVPFRSLFLGCKTFYLIAPSVKNKQIFQENLMQQSLGWKPMFSEDYSRCDAGGCQKNVLIERQALVLPAGMIHMVVTHSESVVLGVNFFLPGHLPTAARGFRHERKDEEPFSSCYPAFPMLALNELMMHLWLVSKIKLIRFVEKNENRERCFNSTRYAIPPHELEDLEEVWRILKAHDKALDNHLARIIYVSTSGRISSQILKYLLPYPENCTQFNRIY